MSFLLKPQAYAYDLVLLGITQDQYKACKWYGQMTENYNAQVLAEMQRLEAQQEKAA
jgi:cobyric acid synthase